MKKVLVVGASGATGRLLVEQLLERNYQVKVVVRSPDKFPEALRTHANLSLVQASLLDLSDEEMQELVKGCDAIASCLGHNLSFKGLYLDPHRLVTNSVRRLCEAAKANSPENPVKFVLMNTTGNINQDRNEKVSFAQRCVLAILRLLLPPHADNEQAAEYLRTTIGQDDSMIQWVAVRPDGLIDETEVSGYDLHPSPTRSAIFDSGQTSRVNVGHFMASLVDEDALWSEWKGQMPVIYNQVV